MSLIQRIDSDIKEAMISKNSQKLEVLRFLKSAMKYVAIEKKIDVLSESDAQSVIQKQIKQRRESIDQFAKGGRLDLADKEKGEVAVLESYLPKQISDTDLQKFVQEEVKASGASSKKDFGRMMKQITEKLAGQAEGKRISEFLGKILV